MSDNKKRIIDYDAASEARTDDNLLMDSPAVGTRKITATNLIKPAMDAVSNEETERQNGDTNLNGKKFGDFVSTTDVTIDGVTYKTFWVIAPTSSNQVYGIANHPTNGRLFKIYNNQGTYSAIPYDKDSSKGDEITTKVSQTGSEQSSLTSTIAANTSLDNAIRTLLNNDVTQDKQISDIESNLTQKEISTFGTAITLTANTDYTTLKDGYFRIRLSGQNPSVNQNCVGTVNGVEMISVNTTTSSASSGYLWNAVFVRKGSVLKYTGTAVAQGHFIPLEQ